MTTTALRAVCPAHPQYKAGCDACRERAATRARTRTRLLAYGRWEGMVDATPARAHIAMLTSAGMSRRAIAAESGVGRTVIDRFCNSNQPRAHATTVRKILAVQAVLPPEASVSSLGASRRLRALMAAGWDAATLAPLLDTSTNQVRRWRWRSQQSMRHDVHQRIAALYRRIGDRPGPSAAARKHAELRGYAPPIFWDDDGDLDNPRSRPHVFGRVAA